MSDLASARQLIQENHPGAALEAEDPAFRENLGRAYGAALARANGVSSYQGYAAVLAGFATDLGDKHIWSRPTFITNVPRWAGIIMAKRGDSWTVASVAQNMTAPSSGARLISCDGVEAGELARTRLGGFRAVWSIEAQQIQSAPWLFVDEGNPFQRRPEACVFEDPHGREAVTLAWKRIKHDDLIPKIHQASGSGASGFGVRPVGGGFWIAVQDLDERGAAVAKAVEQQAPEIRKSEFVVLDLRGNGGGSSAIGRRIAAGLFGRDQVNARLGVLGENDCGGPDGAWRASPGNIADLEYLLANDGAAMGPEGRATVIEQLRQTRRALAEHRALSGPARCAPSIVKREDRAPSGLNGPLILLTDSLCFSSCLSVVDDFRHLGAFHVGQTTDAATHYAEVREQYLPSGFSMFSTLQALDASDPLNFGPFVPRLRYDGDIADTSALEAWVRQVVAPAAVAADRHAAVVGLIELSPDGTRLDETRRVSPK